MIGALTNHLWQSTLFAAAAGLLTVAFRKNRAQVRYWLWFCASCKFLVPFALLISLGGHSGWAPAARKAVTQVAVPAVSLTLVQITQPFSAAMQQAPSGAARDWVPLAIFGVWACGFAAIATIRFRGWLRIRAALRASSAVDIPAPVPVRTSPGLLEPGIVRLWRPVLLLPAGIEHRLTPLQLNAVLAHEFCHARRRDNLTAAIHMIVEAVFWFHPLVWWIGARLIQERERACDEAVLSLGGEASDYANGILKVCKLYVESPIACVSGVTGSDLRKRIQTILAERVANELSFARKAALTVAGMAALAAPIVIGMISGGAVRAQSPPFVPWESLPGNRLMVPQIQTQSKATPAPQFEVASIKLANPTAPWPGRMGARIDTSPGLLSTRNATLKELIEGAYAIENYQVTGGPEWIVSARFEVQAKSAGTASRDQLLVMLRPLLADRFKLAFHRETRELAVYALVVAKGGPKFKKFQVGAESAPLGVNRLGRNVDMAWLAKYLTRFGSDLPVIDRTGLIGNYDLDLDMQRISAAAGAGAGPGIGSMFQATANAIEEVGLKLVRTKAALEVLVIDHVERPSAN